jgi:hypothetical protein
VKHRDELLTPEKILALKPLRGKPRIIVWDSERPGLGIRVTGSLKRSFIIRKSKEDSFETIYESAGH